MELLVIQIFLLTFYEVNSQKRLQITKPRQREVFFHLPRTGVNQGSRLIERLPQISRAGEIFAQTVFNLFDIGGRNDKNVIYAPGVSAFVRPSRLINQELNEVTSKRTEFKTRLGGRESKFVRSSETSSKSRSKPRFDPQSVKSFGLPEVSQIGNLFNLADRSNNDINFPSIETKLNHDLMQPTDNTITNNFQGNLKSSSHAKRSFEKRKWLKDLEAAKKKPRGAKKRPDTNIFGLSPSQELVQPKNDLGFMGGYTADIEQAQEDQQLLDMITQGLHPLQEQSVPNPKPRTKSDGKTHEEMSEVPGLHFQQAFAKSNSDSINFNTDSKNPLGFNVLEPSASEFIASVNELRQERPLIGMNSLNEKPTATNQSPAENVEFKLRNSLRRRNPQPLTIPKTQPNGFGLRHGINNHPNIFNYFSQPNTAMNETQNILIKPEPSIREIISEPQEPTVIRPKPKRIRKPKRIYPDTRFRPIVTEDPLFKDRFPVNINSLPSLELTSDYLPVGTLEAGKPNLNTETGTVTFPKPMPRTVNKKLLKTLWLSNFMLPRLSLNSVTEKNIKEKSSFLNKDGRIVDTVKETKSRHQFNFTQEFKPMVKALLTSTTNQKQSPRSIPMIVSRSRVVPKSRNRNTMNANPNSLHSKFAHSKFAQRQIRRKEANRPKLQPRRQRWGNSKKSLHFIGK